MRHSHEGFFLKVSAGEVPGEKEEFYDYLGRLSAQPTLSLVKQGMMADHGVRYQKSTDATEP